MRIKSFAKINLGLEVLAERPDGYHEIRTVFQSVGLFDVLRISPRAEPVLALAGSDPAVAWDETNLIARAARLLREAYGVRRGAEIFVEKNIPPGTGLGGGSSNAAMALWGLSRLWGLPEDKPGLLSLAGRLGADVPYFLEGGLCLGTGRGDVLTPLPERISRHCLLVLPPFPVPTALVYGNLDPALTSEGKAGRIDAFLRTDELGVLDNGLEETIFRLFPRIEGIKSLLQSLGPEVSLVSGSGSAVFGLFRERQTAEAALATVRNELPAVLVEFVSRRRYWTDVNAGA
ncbi:MAG: 4-(cytidine 5'-diphospho)-2-C-methyl-D-erythritol kinase [Candidatus Aminicenantes bacterium]|nr:4-(cytidine 5'-diphospho)-2-C-methyl-D-erythritol kinase [Candidatus Aminicenantes bacterium]